MNFDEEAIKLHKEYGGKLEIKSKVPIQTRDDLSIAYTPGVAAVSEAIAKNPERVYELTMKKNTVAIITDGSAILGLGNLGALAAIPVMEGKAILFKEFAGVDAFPICLDTQEPEKIIETVKRIAPVFGGINLEDIAAPKCFYIETRLRAELDIPVMQDDQHGTAVVVLAALINSIKLAELDKRDVRVVLSGAGAAGISIANILILYGFKNLILLDSKGIISSSRSDLSPEKLALLPVTNLENKSGGLAEALAGADVFIGVSKGNLLTADLVRGMNTKPIIFAMANPTPEIMPDIARDAGAFIVGTGRSDFPNQINNVLAFPGLFRGALDKHIKQFTDDMFVRAAEALADHVKNPTVDNILPSTLDKGVARAIAEAI